MIAPPRRRGGIAYGPRTLAIVAITTFAIGAFMGGSLGMHGSLDGGGLVALVGRRRRLQPSPEPSSPPSPSPLSSPTPSTSASPSVCASVVPPPPNVTGPRDLVICLAEGREYKGDAGLRWLARFGGSFRRYNADADIVFITSAVNESIAPYLEDVRMTPLLFGDAPEPWGAMEVATRRWYLIRRFLEAHAAEYAGRWVLAIDARDTFFQSDPFAWPRNPGDELYVVTEGKGEPIVESDWNSKILSSCYTYEQLAPVVTHPVSCSGTVMGSYDGAEVKAEWGGEDEVVGGDGRGSVAAPGRGAVLLFPVDGS